MSVLSAAPGPSAANVSSRAKPKPYSIERRFRLMQAAVVALTLWFVSGMLFWNFLFEKRLFSSVEMLHSTLVINREFHEKQEIAWRAFWETYDNQPGATRERYEESARLASDALHQYDRISLPPDEQSEVDRIQSLQKKFLRQASAMLAAAPGEPATLEQKASVALLDRDIHAALGRLEDLQIRRLESLNADMVRFWRLLELLLIAFAIFAIVMWAKFRHMHRHHLWGPLEHLRRMVIEVHRGNLAVSGEVPQSVELGSLIGAFLEMAAEVREVRDSLEERVLERTTKLEQAQSELLQSAKLASLGLLVSGVAHEFNNPLTSILGFSEVLLGRKNLDPSTHVPLRTIRDEALRLRHLVSNLTTFARRAPSRTSRFDLRQALLRFTDLRDYQLQSNNLSLHMDCPPSPVWVVADADQIMQVLLNLALNSEQAIKSRGERGDIWIACGEDFDGAWFRVRDNGGGIPPEVRAHIFDPFFTTRPPGEGSGLGLSISYGIIRQHGGILTAETKFGEGSNFTVRLPRADRPERRASDEPEQPASAAAAAPVSPAPLFASAVAPPSDAPAGQIRRALVIDDEPGILEMVGDALSRIHCCATLLEGSAGVEAALEKESFDLVLCDLKMPGRNGIEIYRLISRLRPELASRFILMTGNLADAEKYRADLAAVSLLPKPFTLARLRDAVEDLLRRHALA